MVDVCEKKADATGVFTADLYGEAWADWEFGKKRSLLFSYFSGCYASSENILLY